MKVGKTLPWRIKAKSKNQARDRYFSFLQRSLNCVSEAFWHTGPTRHKDQMVALITVDPVALACTDGSKVYLRALQNFHYIEHPDYDGEWKVKTDRYIYSISSTPELEGELVSFHWHPSVEGVDFPHLHAAIPDGLHKAHIPTGRVYFEDVLRLLIRDFKVKPLREDWLGLLGDATERAKQFGSWH